MAKRSKSLSVSAPVEFNPDYTQTKADLKRIGILAGSFFALLVVLSFIMPYLQR